MGMEQVVKHPTREDNIIDLVITNMPQLIPRVEMLPGLGDHDIVYFEFKTKLSHNIRKPRSVPIYKNANWENIKDDMSKTEVAIREMAEDPNTTTGMLYDAFEERLNKSTKENIPEKVLKKRVEYPWITNEVKKLMRRRDRLYRKWKKNKAEEKEKELKEIKREIQRKIRRAHWNYVNNLTTKQENDEHEHQKTKRFFSYIKLQKNSDIGVAPLKDQGKLITDPEKKAELLNKTFQEAFSSGSSYTDEEIAEKCQMPLDETSFKTMPDIKITRTGVQKILEKLDPSKAAGPDGITTRVLSEKFVQRSSTNINNHLPTLLEDRPGPYTVEEG